MPQSHTLQQLKVIYDEATGQTPAKKNKESLTDGLLPAELRMKEEKDKTLFSFEEPPRGSFVSFVFLVSSDSSSATTSWSIALYITVVYYYAWWFHLQSFEQNSRSHQVTG